MAENRSIGAYIRGDVGNMLPEMHQHLSDFRSRYADVPMTSGFRARNRLTNSQHAHGRAFDFSVRGLPEYKKREIVNWWRERGATGIGYYPHSDSIHVDFRPQEGGFQAWGPNYSRTSLGQTPVWFQQIAAEHRGGQMPRRNANVEDELFTRYMRPEAPAPVTAPAPAIGRNGQPLAEITVRGQAAPAARDELLDRYMAPEPVAAPVAESQSGTAPLQPGRLERFADGLVRGGKDMLDTLRPLGRFSAEGVGDAIMGGLNRAGVVPDETIRRKAEIDATMAQQAAAEQAQFSAENPLMSAGGLGRVGGNIAATWMPAGLAARVGSAAVGATPLLGAIPGAGLAGGGAAAGATANALLGQPIGEGAAAGAVAGPVAGAVSNVVQRGVNALTGGGVDRNTALLAQAAREQYGIPVTAGQISNSPATRMLDSVTSRIPGSGAGASREAQQVGFNRAVANTFGENAERITPDVMAAAKRRLGQEFDAVAAATTIRIDLPFIDRLRMTLNEAKQVLPEQEVRPLFNQIRNIAETVHGGQISGASYQALTRQGAPLTRAQSSSDPNVRYYANQIRETLDDVMQRSAPPEMRETLQNARRQYRAMKTVEDLVEKSSNGDISPRLLMGAVRANTNNMAYGGGGEQADLARIGQRFLRDPPNSGTADRLYVMQLLGMGGLTGAGTVGAAYDPVMAAKAAGVAGMTMLGARGVQGVLNSNFAANRLINSGLRQAAPTPNALLGPIPPSLAAIAYPQANALSAP